MDENTPYHMGNTNPQEDSLPRPPKAMPNNPHEFGTLLAHLRAQAGYTQKTFAQEIGISQRMVAYFESENGNPPLPILRKFVKALGVSADQLLGLEKVTARKKPRDTRLQQRFSQVEKLPEAEKKDVARYLDKVIRLAKLEQTKP
jgi:transcriptional regulator with XRE-family HTH domain